MKKSIKTKANSVNTPVVIGMDMGDKQHKAVVLGGDGREIGRHEVCNTPQALRAFLAPCRGATLTVETGTHCRWVGALAKTLGLRVLIANARKTEAIWKSSRKNDWRDAEMLAKLTRTDASLLHPVQLRRTEDQELMRLVKSRDLLVRSRANIVNQIRGMCKSEGIRLKSCSAEAFVKRQCDIPEALAFGFAPLFETLAELSAAIKKYNGMIQNVLQFHKKEEAAIVMQIPGVGAVTAAALLAVVGDATQFRHARDVGAFLGLVPRQRDSGGSNPQLRITKEGNPLARRLLVVAANYILGPFGLDSDLRRHGLRIAERGGKNAKKRAKVAVARKLAVTLVAMLQQQAQYRPLSEDNPPSGATPAEAKPARPAKTKKN